MSSMKYYYELTISSSPHAHNSNTTQHIMRDVIIALIPALAGSVYFFGPRALTVTLISMLGPDAPADNLPSVLIFHLSKCQ